MINLNDYKELGFDSKEEYMIQIYFDELIVEGFVLGIEHQPSPFILSNGLPKKFFTNRQLKTKIKN